MHDAYHEGLRLHSIHSAGHETTCMMHTWKKAFVYIRYTVPGMRRPARPERCAAEAWLIHVVRRALERNLGTYSMVLARLHRAFNKWCNR